MPRPSLPDRERAVPRVSLELDTSRGANQADAKGTDVNAIVAQYAKSGTLPNVQNRNPLFGDFTFPDDIHSMREAVFGAEERFNQLPAAVRTAAGNDWGTFIQMFDNPTEREKLLEAGLGISPPVPNNSPQPATPLSTPPTPASEPDPEPAPIPSPT